MLDIEQFDESLTYSGTIAPENNYLAKKYLISEQEMAFDKVSGNNNLATETLARLSIPKKSRSSLVPHQ